MNLSDDLLKFEERAAFSLRELYRRYGYTRYRMSRFEEYDLYAGNKDFLESENIITFTDTNGRLMALKPDMTLSIVRNTVDAADTVSRVYYDENVYRVTARSHAFAEIRQVGLECIGAVDDYCVAEVLSLAAESLAAISPEAVLDISHLGIVEELLGSITTDHSLRERMLRCIGEKNLHGLSAVLDETDAPEDAKAKLKELTGLCGSPESVLPRLKALGVSADAVESLSHAVSMAKEAASGVIIRLNFSTAGDMRYYNGIVFRGYVSGVPQSVLSGGRYDRLPRRMGKHAGAIGFAVSLDSLELLRREKTYDVDALLLYDASVPAAAVSKAVGELVQKGLRVSAQRAIPQGTRYRELYQLDESGVHKA